MSDQRDDWEPEEFAAVCRPVTLASGETVPVLGGEPLSPEEAVALGELVELVRAKVAAENPSDEGTAELYERIEAARGELNRRQVAARCGVRFSTLFKIGQGRMPGADDLAKVEAWLAGFEPADRLSPTSKATQSAPRCHL